MQIVPFQLEMEIDGHSRLNVEWTSKYYFQNPAPLNVESNLLVLETKAYIRVAGLKPIIGLLSEKSASATLVQLGVSIRVSVSGSCHVEVGVFD